MSIKKKSFISLLWFFVGNSFTQAVSLAVFLYLARIIDVEEFGIVTFAFLILEFLNTFLNVGVTPNLIRRKIWDDTFSSSAHWMLLGLAVVLSTFCVAILAPLIDYFVNSSTAEILSVLAFLPILNASRMVHTAKMRRDYRTKNIVLVESLGTFAFGAIALTLAFRGHGAWSLAYGRIAQTVIVTFGLVWSSDFKVRYSLSKSDIQENLRFGLPLFYVGLLGFVSNRSSHFLVGVVLGPAAFAFYSLARRIFQIVIELTFQPVNRVLVSTFSEGTDAQSYDAYYRVVRLAAFSLAPVFLAIGALADPFFILIIGDKWAKSIELMQILAFLIVTPVYGYFYPTLLISKGLTTEAAKLKTINLAIGLGTPAAFVYFGIEALVVAIVISNCMLGFLCFKYTKKYLDISGKRIINQVAPFYLSALFMYLVSRVCVEHFDSHEIEYLALYIVITISAYFLPLLTLFKKQFWEVVKEVKSLNL